LVVINCLNSKSFIKRFGFSYYSPYAPPPLAPPG